MMITVNCTLFYSRLAKRTWDDKGIHVKLTVKPVKKSSG